MDPYQQHSVSTTEPTQSTEETFFDSYQYYRSSAMETHQSAEVPSVYSYPDSSSQILAWSSQTANLNNSVYNRSRKFLSFLNLTCTSNYCLYPGCDAKPFKRTADLQRHYRNIHNPDLTESHLCDYPKCTRASEPFRRRDHFRDHLREYHREDIQKRGIVVNEEWLEDRSYSDNWWRCPRCLIRVYTSKDEFECPQCKGSCEPKRKEKRRGN